jgi:hypothetical protein
MGESEGEKEVNRKIPLSLPSDGGAVVLLAPGPAVLGGVHLEVVIIRLELGLLHLPPPPGPDLGDVLSRKGVVTKFVPPLPAHSSC